MLTQSTQPKNIDFASGEVILIDKPSGISSFDVIRKLKRIVYIKKIGHAGTLDPLATGLLILCTGKFTKRINEFQGQDKEYYGSLRFGGETASYDSETEIVQTYDYSNISEADIKEAASTFLGEIIQVPPVYSAIKLKGERLYKKALKGEKVSAPPRCVSVSEFSIDKIDMPDVDFHVNCSKGTYVRSLVHDLAKKINNGAYMTALRRTKIGDIHVNDALSIEAFESLIKKSEIAAHENNQ